MDLYEWAEGTWYAEMARIGRELYEHGHVGGDAAGTITRLIYGMEARALECLGPDAVRDLNVKPPQRLIASVLSGETEHRPGPPLRPYPGQSQDHFEQVRQAERSATTPARVLHPHAHKLAAARPSSS